MGCSFFSCRFSFASLIRTTSLQLALLSLHRALWGIIAWMGIHHVDVFFFILSLIFRLCTCSMRSMDGVLILLFCIHNFLPTSQSLSCASVTLDLQPYRGPKENLSLAFSPTPLHGAICIYSTPLVLAALQGLF